MIDKLSHASIPVLDQDSAYDFYVNKLGFEVRMDARMDNGFRWLTVGPKTQPDLEIILLAVEHYGKTDEEKAAFREFVANGRFGGGVFSTPDCRATYEELKGKGVKFRSEPEEQFYGIEAVLEDDSGNWFSMTQRKH